MVRKVCIATALALILVPPVGLAATPVLTRSYDNARTGANLTETKLTPELVAAKGLSLKKSLAIDDDPRVEAQPLYVPNLVMSDGKPHNVVFVASMGDHVYAFDADAPQGQDLLWKTSLGQSYLPPEKPKPGQHRKTDSDWWGVNILWGVLSTPVIDLDTMTMYCVNLIAQRDASGEEKPVLVLHRLRLKDGKETSEPADGLPLEAALRDETGKVIKDSSGQPVELRPFTQRQRAALLLAPLSGPHKTLFVAMGGGEAPGAPHGWVLAIDVDSFKETATWVSTQRGFGGGIWQGSGGPAADEAGNVYAMTGNGGYSGDSDGNVVQDFNGATDFAEAFVKLSYHRESSGRGSLELVDWLIPFRDSDRNPPVADNNHPNYRDQDLASSGPVLPPGTNLLLGAGKDGLLYVLDRNNLGKKVGAPGAFDAMLRALKAPPIYVTFDGAGLPTSGPGMDFPLGDPTRLPSKTKHLHATPVYWDGGAADEPMLFFWGENDSLRAWTINPKSGRATFVGRGAEVASRRLALQPTGFGGMTGGMVTVSSNGKTPNTGIVWATAPLDGDANHDVVEGVVRAYDATQFSPTPIDATTPRLKLIWDSSASGVDFFAYSKFNPPVVADGRLLVPTYDGRVNVYVLADEAAAANMQQAPHK